MPAAQLMTTTITVPSSLDDRTFEEVISQLAAVPLDDELVVDARHCTWASPYGLIALLTLAQTRSVRPLLLPPDSDEIAAYWSRVGFFRHAEELYGLTGRIPADRRGAPSTTLIEITPLAPDHSPTDVVSDVLSQTNEILRASLSLETRAAMRLTMTVSEACQGLLDHAGCSGWLALQVFNFRKRMGQAVAIIAIADAGKSCWDNRARRTVLESLSGRVAAHSAKFSVRSGTRRQSIVPAWDDDLPLIEHLAPFPGTQLQFTIPANTSAGAG